MGSGALASLRELDLMQNAIGDVGLQSLAHAIMPVSEGGSGALARCTSIDLSGNPANDEAKKSVERALKDRWLDGDFLVKNLSDVESLPCYGLGWGDAEIIKLASAIEYACANGALASLSELYVDDGPLGTEHPALKAACEARGIELP